MSRGPQARAGVVVLLIGGVVVLIRALMGLNSTGLEAAVGVLTGVAIGLGALPLFAVAAVLQMLELILEQLRRLQGEEPAPRQSDTSPDEFPGPPQVTRRTW